MRFASLLSTRAETADAMRELIDGALRALAGHVDLAVLFFTPEHCDDADPLAERAWLGLDATALAGASTSGLIGAGQEVEEGPAMALWAADLGGARLHTTHVGEREFGPLVADPELLRARIAYAPDTRLLLALGDPYSTPLNGVLGAINQHCPGLPVVGGMASSGQSPLENRLIAGEHAFGEGMALVSISGEVEVRTLVSQGCRPVGQRYVITRAQGHRIEQLAGRPAIDMLRQTLESLPPEEMELLKRGVLIGRVMNEYQEDFGRGDFVIRNLTAIDRAGGALAISDRVRVGQTVQFHVRDAASADEDLRALLGDAAGFAAQGGLLFTCNGRGRQLFDQPHHDARAAADGLGGIPIAGMFAAGEIGPVGGVNHVHGHTASLALFRPPASGAMGI